MAALRFGTGLGKSGAQRQWIEWRSTGARSTRVKPVRCSCNTYMMLVLGLVHLPDDRRWHGHSRMATAAAPVSGGTHGNGPRHPDGSTDLDGSLALQLIQREQLISVVIIILLLLLLLDCASRSSPLEASTRWF